MSNPILICEDNISIAWAKALREVRADQARSLCVSITGFEEGEVLEDENLRDLLDNLLRSKSVISARETSETIFPYHYWRQNSPTADELYTWYLERYLPRHRVRVRKVARGNTMETYFERLIAYRGFKVNNDSSVSVNIINQLQRIINVYTHYSRQNRSPSPSKFIATCLNPSVDNTNLEPYFKFPCLQQVGFSMSEGAVTVSGYYTIQYLMKRGYGNYLGLCYLGKFMSKETGLPLRRVNCFVGNPRPDNFTRAEIAPILEAIPRD
ncbi:hypothetical protein [Desulfovibrio aminophilus]|uniref:hypothetical protein n=1 Tax=Desulfovibrio aminophilus TaxID=81425 RepID=UPI003391DB13